MKKPTLTSVLLLGLLGHLLAQHQTYLGVEVAVTNGLSELEESGSHLQTAAQIGGFLGVKLRQDIHKNFFIETGLIKKYAGSGFLVAPLIQTSSQSIRAWLIPLQLGTRIRLIKGLFLVAGAGYAWAINSSYGNRASGFGTSNIQGVSVTYEYSYNPNLAQHFSLAQAEIGLEMKLSNKIALTIVPRYYKGFREISEFNVSYTINESTPQTGRITDNSDFWSVVVGLKYPISNLWTSARRPDRF